LRILFIGDIFAKPGRNAVRHLLPSLIQELRPDIVLANLENLAGGAGLTEETCNEMFALGIRAATTGNHVWDHREVFAYFEKNPPIVRPLNYPAGAPGRGWLVLEDLDLLIVNLQGRVFMRSLDDPFLAMDALLSKERHRFTFVDFHAEATGEKRALGLYLDGRVGAFTGTHTHVQTADEQCLPKGTGYITDAGMVGPRHSVIGTEPQSTIRRYLTQLPYRFQTGSGAVDFNGVVFDLDDTTGLCSSVTRIQRTWSPE